MSVSPAAASPSDTLGWGGGVAVRTGHCSMRAELPCSLRRQRGLQKPPPGAGPCPPHAGGTAPALGARWAVRV